MTATQLLLVRHGTTDANVQVPYILQGSSIDLPLNDNGRRQAQQVAGFLADHPIKHVYSSPLQRAAETAGVIAGRHGLAVNQIAEITECHVGVWEGKDWDTIARETPEAYRLFHEDPAAHPYLGGESYSDVLRRAWPAFERLLHRHVGDTVVVVAHNIVNRVLCAHLMGLELRKAKGLAQDNCCVNIIQHADGKSTLVTMNSVFHLRG
ncbi:MAG: histidine phosphatase family protein [Planctomycetes bacterium]|nr:histidine phosphatase family protein [Planctomycetota bacterium]